MRHLNEIELVMALDGELSAVELTLAQAHAKECAECGARFESLRATSERVVEYQHTLYSDQKPVAADERRLRPMERRPWFSAWQWQVAAAVVVLVIGVTWYANFSGSHPIAAKNQDRGDKGGAQANTTRPVIAATNGSHPVAQEQKLRDKSAARSVKNVLKTPGAAKPDMTLAQFTELPFSDTSLPLADATVVRVKLPAAALRQAGVPVEEDSANAMLQADVVLGLDGLPRGIRLVKGNGANTGAANPGTN